MRTVNVDVAIIGAGTAGLAAFRAAKKAGKSALLVEAGAYGTTCARVGCMPSKLLIAAAESAHHARVAAPFGVHTTVEVDGRAVMDRVRRERDRFVGFVLASIETLAPEERLLGRARFVSPTELSVTTVAGDVRVTMRSAVIATGSVPYIPAMFERVRDRLVVNDDVFGWSDLPASLAVFGAGVIGLELGQAFQRLGVRVRVFGRGNTVGPLADPVVKQRAAEIFHEELDVDFDAHVTSVEPDGAGVVVAWTEADGRKRTESFAAALIAAGRRANLMGIALENAGIVASSKVDRRTLQYGKTNIFSAGDATDDIPLLHEAADEGEIAGANAARFPAVTAGARRSGLGIAFSDPAIAVVGGGYAAAAQKPYVVGEVDFGDQGRSRILLQNRGLARLYADPATRRFLGAEMIGPRVEHLAHLLAWAHQAEMTVDTMLAMPFYHPVIEEGLRTALRALASALSADGFRGGEKATT